jgi:hypothetical protein
VKDDAHGAFTPEMMKLPQATWVETFLEGLPIFKELAWFAYKVSGVMCSASACEHCWSIEGWIHSKRRNKLHQKLVEKLVRTLTNLVLRESLDVVTHTPISIYSLQDIFRDHVCSKKDKICRCGPVHTVRPPGLTPIYLPGTGGRLCVGKDSEGGRGKKEPLYIYTYLYIYIYVNKKLYHLLKIIMYT